MGKITVCRAPDDSDYVALDEQQAVIARRDCETDAEAREALIDALWSNELYAARYPEGYTIEDWTSHD